MLIAIMLAVVVGMAALAIDGSRAYALRRDLQAAVDGAALAAGDRLQQGGTYPQAEQAAATSFFTNLRLYASPPPCSGYGTPGPSPVIVTCTWPPPDGTILTEVVLTLGPQGSLFTLSGSRALQLQFARILTNGATPRLVATAFGSVNNLLYAPAVAALNQAGCGGKPGSAISINGTGTLDVQGDVVSSGAISASAGNVSVAGDIYARCQSTIPGSVTTACSPSDTPTPCTFPNVAGFVRSGYHFVDPRYPPPVVTGSGQPTPGFPTADPVLKPGSYNVDPILNLGQCWFLSGGVYDWVGGFTNDGDFVSNELKPPAEPVFSDNTTKLPMRRQFWNTNGVNCAGDFQLNAIGASLPISVGTWAIEITSTRTDKYNGTDYFRESAPSYCQTVSVSPGQVIQVQVSNVPGATGYNVYVALPGSGCSGTFGLAGSISVPMGTVFNDNTSRCPEYTSESGHCSLNFESVNFDSTLLGAGFVPSLAPQPPDGETAPLGFRQVNQNPDRAAPSHGDRANENQCDTLAGALTMCPGPVTPGAVSMYLPSGGLACLTDTNNGDNFIFSGYQYNWVAVYEPSTATCTNPNLLDASSNSAYVGLLYTPSNILNIPTRVGFRTEATGGIIADTINFSGQLPLIVSSPAYSPVPPAAKLVS